MKHVAANVSCGTFHIVNHSPLAIARPQILFYDQDLENNSLESIDDDPASDSDDSTPMTVSLALPPFSAIAGPSVALGKSPSPSFSSANSNLIKLALF